MKTHGLFTLVKIFKNGKRPVGLSTIHVGMILRVKFSFVFENLYCKPITVLNCYVNSAINRTTIEETSFNQKHHV